MYSLAYRRKMYCGYSGPYTVLRLRAGKVVETDHDKAVRNDQIRPIKPVATVATVGERKSGKSFLMVEKAPASSVRRSAISPNWF